MGKNNKKKNVQIRVVGQRRNEPDVRRIAKAIIHLAIDAEDATDRFDELGQTERAIDRRRKSGEVHPPDQAAS